MLLLTVTFLLLLPLFSVAQISFTTIPSYKENEDVIIVSDDNSTVDIYCLISFFDGSVTRNLETDWKILYNGTIQDISYYAGSESAVTFDFFKRVLDTGNSNVTFHLTQENSQTKLLCTNSGKSVTFFIGIPGIIITI